MVARDRGTEQSLREESKSLSMGRLFSPEALSSICTLLIFYAMKWFERFDTLKSRSVEFDWKLYIEKGKVRHISSYDSVILVVLVRIVGYIFISNVSKL